MIAENKVYLALKDITAYTSAFQLCNYVWKIVIEWDYFSKKTVGEQFVRSVDSISANVAEGFGRYFKKDKIKFYYYAFGSVKESMDWNQKSFIRGLVIKEQYEFIFSHLNSLPRDLHSLIKYTNEKLKQ